MQRHLPVTPPQVVEGLWLTGPNVSFVSPAASWQTFCPQPLPCFAPVICDFVAALSIRLQQEGRRHPDLAAFGFWLRPRQLAREQQRLQGRGAVGVVFHLVPSNVPTVAFYSWLMALLMGNPCVVRLSSRRDPVQDAMLAILNDLFRQVEWQEIAMRTRFIRYDHDEGITSWLSARCRLRIIWGGDETIRQVRAIPLSPSAQEVVFPDRRSMAVLDNHWLAGLDAVGWQQTLGALQQDCTRFNQQACASPTTLCWLGEPDDELRHRLLEALFAPFADDPALVMERLIHSQQNAALDGEMQLSTFPGVTLLTPAASLRLAHVGGGTVAEFVADSLNELLLQPWDMQTCVWVGANKAQLEDALPNAPVCRIDRVVAPGQALAFEWHWDGIDMLHVCSRGLAQHE
ncbi:acyl-CoA reductase [Aeromonas sp. 2MA4]|uniref:acyl-CoA reductase n=1 Tax=Aeromonas sp. 2MA4 TaxID=2699195 RepID=UPI0023DD6777|nr:acyl-CoA reductase [Aeromonas sp. 2MA4]MDF2391385.1 acyl-CoA reductase [Aeromonas sp. 2MA4]